MEVNNKNEQGYALVTVLLIVTVFTVIFLSFMGQAFSSVKQNQVVEKTTRSVAAAEMGISYYQVTIQNMFKLNQTTVTEYVRSIMDDETIDSETVDFKRLATEKMAEQLQIMIPVESGLPIESIKYMIGTPTEPIRIDDHPNASYYIKDFKAEAVNAESNRPYIINISFNVVGTEDGKDTILSTKMFIDLNTIVNLPTTENPDNYQMPSFNNIKKPTTNTCITLACNNVVIEGNADFQGNNELKSFQTIYVTSTPTQPGNISITGQGNENNITNINIHAEGDIYIGQNMNRQIKLTLETNGNATFGQNLKINSYSNLLVNRNLKVIEGLSIEDHSFAYIGENATVNSLTIQTSSKMCVKGNLNYNQNNGITVTTKNNDDLPSKLYVSGDVNKYAGLDANNNPKYVIDTAMNTLYKVSSLEFAKQCGTYVPPEFEINWGDRISPVISDVEY
ncbi:hypothetical protein MLOOGBEN_05795 [Bacillus sp. EB106-08-02-XG196]|uniref:hypothetical protein n=1 Tax=Bacillus sp. EB106-08-02-XG196 TaxID=2737049 RepID=UPI0015C47CD9|nr:hypothetical protein [Bacillus sp. EB106-08-02-XG196]NWQ40209.1 hypothetical protein [Bacillus sp. EB106-08-02-XG196]